MKTAAVVCLLVLYAVSGDAHEWSVARFKSSKVTKAEGKREVRTSYGTCWLADLKDAGLKGKGLIVTAAHTLEGHERFFFEWSYRWVEAKVVFADVERDVAVLKSVARLKGTMPFKLAKDRILTFHASGYGQGVTSYTALPDKVVLDKKIEPGNSGSPVVGKDKRVVGMIIAARGVGKKKLGKGVFAHASVIRAAITAHLKKETKKKETESGS